MRMLICPCARSALPYWLFVVRYLEEYCGMLRLCCGAKRCSMPRVASSENATAYSRFAWTAALDGRTDGWVCIVHGSTSHSI